MKNLRLSYEGLRLIVRAHADDRCWLTEVLEPSFQRWRPGAKPESRSASVTLRRDDALYASHRQLAPLGRHSDFFALDSGMARAEEIAWAGQGERLFFDARLEVFYRTWNRGSEVEIVATRAGGRARVAALRVARELAMLECRYHQRPVLHGAAFVVEDALVVVLGAKGSGKSTLLLHCLLSSSARYAANDRVALDPWETPAKARGIPTLISLRPGTLEIFPTLAARLRAAGYHYRASLAEHHAGSVPRVPRPLTSGLDLTAPQVLEAVDGTAVGGGRVGCLLFLGERGEEGQRWRRLEPQETALRLQQNLCAGGRVSTILRSPTTAGSPPALASACAEAARSIPAFELRVPSLEGGHPGWPDVDTELRGRVLSSAEARLD